MVCIVATVLAVAYASLLFPLVARRYGIFETPLTPGSMAAASLPSVVMALMLFAWISLARVKRTTLAIVLGGVCIAIVAVSTAMALL